ncbi:MAG TPA: energy transducer TonB [Ramlibacter sp.]|nr:energy transducer TonB [Ramlibacter sp.]
MTEPAPASRRNTFIVGTVMLFHVGALWALQTGLLRRAVEIIVPVQVFSELVTPSVPPPPPRLPEPVRQREVRKTAPALPAAPVPVAIADPTPGPNAPTGTTAAPAPLPPIAAPVAEAAAPVAPPAPPKVDLPSSDADYLQNPKPAYPPLSKRLGEQGKVVVRVLIGPDGTAHQVELRQSSGYERLDQAALATVQRWRYVPGKRGGVAEAMWFNVPINFVLG